MSNWILLKIKINLPKLGSIGNLTPTLHLKSGVKHIWSLSKWGQEATQMQETRNKKRAWIYSKVDSINTDLLSYREQHFFWSKTTLGQHFFSVYIYSYFNGCKKITLLIYTLQQKEKHIWDTVYQVSSKL